MTELELYKFCEDKEIDWRGDELVIWLYFWDLEEFTELIGEDFFSEGGLDVNLQYKQVAFDLVPICESWDIEPTNILKQED